MPPQLALLLCTAFVLFLLWLDRKQAPHVSHALWVPTAWMLLIASKPLGIWFGTGVDATGSMLDRVFLSALLCVGLFILLMRNFDWFSAIKENGWVIVLVLYMLVSVSWSDMPFISLKRWVREVVAIVMAFLVLSEREPREALLSVFRRTIYVLIPFSVVLIKYYPAYGVSFSHWSGNIMWIGVCLQKNSLGRLCMFAVFFLVLTLVMRWRKRDLPVVKHQTKIELLLLFIALWLLRGPGDAYSATSIAALAAGFTTLIGLLWLKRRHSILGRNAIAIMAAVVICYGTLVPMLGGLSFGFFSSALGRDETLTGRTDIWSELVPTVRQHPILGAGYGAFWTPEAIETHGENEAHNGYLDTVLDLGFVGLTFICIFLLWCCRNAQRAFARDFDLASFWVCFLIMTVIHNLSESSINTFTSHLTAILLFLAASVQMSARRQGRVL